MAILENSGTQGKFTNRVLFRSVERELVNQDSGILIDERYTDERFCSINLTKPAH